MRDLLIMARDTEGLYQDYTCIILYTSRNGLSVAEQVKFPIFYRIIDDWIIIEEIIE